MQQKVFVLAPPGTLVYRSTSTHFFQFSLKPCCSVSKHQIVSTSPIQLTQTHATNSCNSKAYWWVPIFSHKTGISGKILHLFAPFVALCPIYNTLRLGDACVRSGLERGEPRNGEIGGAGLRAGGGGYLKTFYLYICICVFVFVYLYLCIRLCISFFLPIFNSQCWSKWWWRGYLKNYTLQPTLGP